MQNRKAAFKTGHSKIHLNLSIALLLGLIVFVSGIERAKDDEVSVLFKSGVRGQKLHAWFLEIVLVRTLVCVCVCVCVCLCVRPQGH